MYKEIFKKRIIEARIGLKMSKGELAKNLNMSLPTYYRFERDGKIGLDDYIKACEILGLCIIVLPKESVTSL